MSLFYEEIGFGFADCGMSGEWDRKIWHDMKFKDVPMSPICYSYVLKLCAMGQDFVNHARRILVDMHRSGVEFNTLAYAAVIDCCRVRGAIDDGEFTGYFTGGKRILEMIDGFLA